MWRVIKVLRYWSLENNLKLNPKKSEIVEFLLNYDRCGALLNIGDELDGIAVVYKYKYLSAWIDGSLSLSPQLEYIEAKSNFGFHFFLNFVYKAKYCIIRNFLP